MQRTHWIPKCEKSSKKKRKQEIFDYSAAFQNFILTKASLKVLQAVAGEDFTVYLYFNDGSVRLYDAKPLLKLGGVFAPLQDEAFFKSRLTVLNDTAAWDVTGDRDPGSCVDLDPIELYENCPVVVDPLESAS